MRNSSALSVLILLSFLCPRLSADDEVQKETCNPPEFSFSWTGYDSVQMSVTAKPAQALVVKLNYLEEPRKGWNSVDPIKLLVATATGSNVSCSGFVPVVAREAIEFCIAAQPEGATASFTADRKAFLAAGGFIGLHYRALPADLPTVCDERKAGPRDPSVKLLDKHSLSFDVGSVFNLQGSGSWETNAEAALISRLQWLESLQSGFSIRYSALGAVAEDETDDTEGEEEEEEEESPEEEDIFNPFEQGGGVFETNVYLLYSPLTSVAPRLGVVVGWGLSSVPGDEGSRLETRERSFFGIRNTFQALNAGRIGDSLENSSGYIQAGWARDDLWEEVEIEPASADGSVPAVVGDESDRYFFEGELDIPRIGTEWFRVALRFFASVPRSGDGPSDLRISALGSIDPRRWFPGLGGSQ